VIAKAALGREKTEIRKKAALTLRPETDDLIRRVFRREIAAFDFCRTPDPRLVDSVPTTSTA
jgi:hypothetical protein